MVDEWSTRSKEAFDELPFSYTFWIHFAPKHPEAANSEPEASFLWAVACLGWDLQRAGKGNPTFLHLLRKEASLVSDCTARQACNLPKLGQDNKFLMGRCMFHDDCMYVEPC